MWKKKDLGLLESVKFINTDGERRSLYNSKKPEEGLLSMISRSKAFIEKITIEGITKDGEEKDLVLAEYDNEIELNRMIIFMSEESGWLTLTMSSKRIWDGIEEFDDLSIKKIYDDDSKCSRPYQIKFKFRQIIETKEKHHLDWKEAERI